MQEKLLYTRWQSIDGKLFQITQVQDDWVWYSSGNASYSCRLEAFKQRFTLLENLYYD